MAMMVTLMVDDDDDDDDDDARSRIVARGESIGSSAGPFTLTSTGSE